MLRVGRVRRQHHLGVAGELDAAPRAAQVGQAQAAQLDVVFRRDNDLGVGVDTLISAAKLGATFAENGFVGVGLPLRGLVRARPAGAGFGVAQVAEAAPGIAGGVFAPARHGQVFPAAVAAARIGDHDVVAAVGQQLHLGRGRVGRGDQAQRRLDGAEGRAQFGAVGGVWMEGHGLRDALLQQQQRGPQLRVGLEAALHRLAEQQVRQCQQAHALVVGHERSHDRAAAPARQPRRRVVDGLVVAVGARQPLFGQPHQVLVCGPGLDHQRHHGGVGRHHQVLGQPALQAQAGHAEGAVLVVQRGVGGVVARLRHAPWHAALAAVVDLPLHRRAHALVEQRVLVAGHHQHRHQVLEHRAAPRQQDRLAVGGGEQAPEREPAVLRHLALGHGDEAAQPNLRGQQVVVARVAAPFVDVVADGHQVARRVVEEAEVHLGQRAGACCQVQQHRTACEQRRRVPGRCRWAGGGLRCRGRQQLQLGQRGAALAVERVGPAPRFVDRWQIGGLAGYRWWRRRTHRCQQLGRAACQAVERRPQRVRFLRRRGLCIRQQHLEAH